MQEVRLNESDLSRGVSIMGCVSSAFSPTSLNERHQRELVPMVTWMLTGPLKGGRTADETAHLVS